MSDEKKPRPVPAKKPAPASGKQRSGPSMKEKILARKKAEAEAAGKDAAAPAAKSVQTAAKKVERVTKPVGKPVAKSGSKPVVTKAAAGRPVVKAGAKPVAKVTKSARPAAVTRRKKGDDDGEADTKRPARVAGGRRGARRDPDSVVGREFKPKKSSSIPLPFIGIVVVLIAAGFGAMKFLGGDDEANAAETDGVAAAGLGAGGEEGGAALDDSGSEDEGTDDEPVIDEPDPDPEPAEEKPKKPKKKLADMTDADYDPSEVSWDDLEKFEASDGTTAEEWAEIKRLVVTFTDPDAGAAGNRAGNKLQEQYKEKAFPALVNKLLTLNLTNTEDHRTGDLVQKRLEMISNGKNAGWKYEIDEWPNRTAKFNRKVVVLLHKVWNRAKDDEAYWRSYAKLEAKGDAEEGDAPAEDAASDDDLDELDDLDDL
ncbi:MAG: hypothetical protein GY711_28285 [bacterium]|nr:hypothetical protein [bacterium]